MRRREGAEPPIRCRHSRLSDAAFPSSVEGRSSTAGRIRRAARDRVGPRISSKLYPDGAAHLVERIGPDNTRRDNTRPGDMVRARKEIAVSLRPLLRILHEATPSAPARLMFW